MADLNPKLHLNSLSLGIDWQVYRAPMFCRGIELTADVPWLWATDKDSGAYREIRAMAREIIIGSMVFSEIAKGEALLWIKAEDAPGNIWEKCVR